jgi:hypothetical protein
MATLLMEAVDGAEIAYHHAMPALLSIPVPNATATTPLQMECARAKPLVIVQLIAKLARLKLA